MDETLVRMGVSAGSDSVILRMVHIWGLDIDTVLPTGILDKDVMPTLDVASMYRRRWSIERMYLAMKMSLTSIAFSTVRRQQWGNKSTQLRFFTTRYALLKAR